MKFTDQRDIHAPREAVWAGITDPDTLCRCIPGCQEMTGSVEEGFEATVVQKVGPVKATFRGAVTVLDMVEGESCTLRGEGKGGPAGFAKGEAKVALSDIEVDGSAGTRLAYEVEAKVGGKLAQLGGRVVDGVAGRISDQFFDRFKEVVEGPGADSGSGSGGGAQAEGAPAAAPAGGGEGTAPASAPATAPPTAGVSAEPADAALAASAEPKETESNAAGSTGAGRTGGEPAGAEVGGAGPIAGGPEPGGPAPGGAGPEKKGWLRRLISRDRPAEG